MSIVTKTGDKGNTGLFGGDRVPKDHPRVEAYGTVDELNAILGCILALHVPTGVTDHLLPVQHLLFRVGADLATPLSKNAKVERVTAEHVAEIERQIAEIEPTLPPQTAFILPGGTFEVNALLHLARTVCRRAERRVVTLKGQEEINEHLLVYLNRLSDYLYVLARKANVVMSMKDVEVQY